VDHFVKIEALHVNEIEVLKLYFLTLYEKGDFTFDIMIGSMMFSNLYEKSEFIFGLKFSLSKILRFRSFVY
jgi:hypothetical protein